jgi:hypothetical protein
VRCTGGRGRQGDSLLVTCVGRHHPRSTGIAAAAWRGRSRAFGAGEILAAKTVSSLCIWRTFFRRAAQKSQLFVGRTRMIDLWKWAFHAREHWRWAALCHREPVRLGHNRVRREVRGGIARDEIGLTNHSRKQRITGAEQQHSSEDQNELKVSRAHCYPLNANSTSPWLRSLLPSRQRVQRPRLIICYRCSASRCQEKLLLLARIGPIRPVKATFLPRAGRAGCG